MNDWFQSAFKNIIAFPADGWILVFSLIIFGVIMWCMANGNAKSKRGIVLFVLLGIDVFAMCYSIFRLKTEAIPLEYFLTPGIIILVGSVMVSIIHLNQKTQWTTQMLALGAVCIALNCVLGMIRLWRLPNGGSVTPASMLPVMLFAYVYGAGPGLTVGALCGVLDYMLGGYFVSVLQWLVDYPVAFAMMGLAGLLNKMKDERIGLSAGVVVASVGRWIAAVVAGVFFWAEYTPEGMSPLVYSLGYNGSYMALECIICVVVAAIIGPRLVRELRKVK